MGADRATRIGNGKSKSKSKGKSESESESGNTNHRGHRSMQRQLSAPSAE